MKVTRGDMMSKLQVNSNKTIKLQNVLYQEVDIFDENIVIDCFVKADANVYKYARCCANWTIYSVCKW